MAFNPKTELKSITAADVSKKDIVKLGKKAIDPTTAMPFFIKTDHTFPDGSIGALFLFGKLNKVKADIRNLKGATELHGVAFVTTDEKGKTTLNLLPSKGKLVSKEKELQKAMKDAFTPAFSTFKIGEKISEEDADKLAEAAEKLEDVAEDAVTDIPKSATPPKATLSEQDKIALQEALKTLQSAYSFLFPNAKKA